jgi:hypothetical protein
VQTKNRRKRRKKNKNLSTKLSTVVSPKKTKIQIGTTNPLSFVSSHFIFARSSQRQRGFLSETTKATLPPRATP